jgi:isocitrate dehydrogenase
MTKDLALSAYPEGTKLVAGEHYLYTEDFLEALDSALQAKLA